MRLSLVLNVLIGGLVYVFVAWMGPSAPRGSLRESLTFAAWMCLIAAGAAVYACAWGVAHDLSPYLVFTDEIDSGVFDNFVQTTRTLAVTAVLFCVHAIVVVVHRSLRRQSGGS